jgi:hypothetical protein
MNVYLLAERAHSRAQQLENGHILLTSSDALEQFRVAAPEDGRAPLSQKR